MSNFAVARGLMKNAYNKRSNNNSRLSGYTEDKRYSSREARVYKDKKGNPTIVFRGTARKRDIGTDIMYGLGLGKHTRRARKSRKLAKRVRRDYKGKKLTAMGHSLGGALAEGIKADRVITYNKAAGLNSFRKKRKSTQIDYRHRGDAVSYLSRFNKGGKTVKLGRKRTGVLKAHRI